MVRFLLWPVVPPLGINFERTSADQAYNYYATRDPLMNDPYVQGGYVPSQPQAPHRSAPQQQAPPPQSYQPPQQPAQGAFPTGPAQNDKRANQLAYQQELKRQVGLILGILY